VLEPPLSTFIPLPPLTSPERWRSHYTPSLLPPFPLLRLIYRSHRVLSFTPPPTRPLGHQTKLIHTFSATFFAALPPSSSPFSIYTREDDRPFTKLRPIYESTYIAHKDCPLRTRVEIQHLSQDQIDAGISTITNSIPEGTYDANEHNSVSGGIRPNERH